MASGPRESGTRLMRSAISAPKTSVDTARVELSIVADPCNPKWELWPIAEGRNWLLAWRVDPWPVDGGVPDRVASVMASAICAAGWVVHLSPRQRDLKSRQGWVDSADHRSLRRCAVRPPPLYRRPHGLWRGLSLSATTDPALAVDAFDAGWSRRAQIIFLLPPGPLPAVDGSALMALLRGALPTRCSLTGAPVLRGVVLPGVDGDVAQLVAFEPELWETVEPVLRQKAAAAGVSIRNETDGDAKPHL